LMKIVGDIVLYQSKQLTPTILKGTSEVRGYQRYLSVI
jgi:hypothetical protein